MAIPIRPATASTTPTTAKFKGSGESPSSGADPLGKHAADAAVLLSYVHFPLIG